MKIRKNLEKKRKKISEKDLSERPRNALKTCIEMLKSHNFLMEILEPPLREGYLPPNAPSRVLYPFLAFGVSWPYHFFKAGDGPASRVFFKITNNVVLKPSKVFYYEISCYK